MKKIMAIILVVAMIVSIVPMAVSAAVNDSVDGDKLTVNLNKNGGTDGKIGANVTDVAEIKYTSQTSIGSVTVSVTPPKGMVVDKYATPDEKTTFAGGVIPAAYIMNAFGGPASAATPVRTASKSITIDVKAFFKPEATMPDKYLVTLGANVSSTTPAISAGTSEMVDRASTLVVSITGGAGVLTGVKVNGVFKPLKSYDALASTGTFEYTVNAAAIIEAVYDAGGTLFTGLSTNVSYKSDFANDADGVKADDVSAVQTGFGSTLVAIASHKEGYKFIGWYKNGSKYSSAATLSVDKADNGTFVAFFQKACGKVEIDPVMANGGTVNTKWLYDGDSATITAKAATGFTFKHWVRTNNTSGASSVVSTSASYSFTAAPGSQYTYTAVFTAPKGAVNVSIGTLNAGGKAAGSGAYVPGKKVTATATPDAGMIVEGWYNASQEKLANGNSFSFTVGSEDTAVFAKFAVVGTSLSPVVAGAAPKGTGSASGSGNPKTGDTSNVIVWALLGIVALGALAVVAKKKVLSK